MKRRGGALGHVGRVEEDKDSGPLSLCLSHVCIPTLSINILSFPSSFIVGINSILALEIST